MKIKYYEETNTLYIHLNDNPGEDVINLNDYINIDVDEKGRPVGIEILQNADRYVNLKTINIETIADTHNVNSASPAARGI